MSEDKNNNQGIDIGRQIDDLLDMDDGKLLAEMAALRSNVLSLFGLDEIVDLIRKSVDEAENVEFFTDRSRRDIDKHRPVINLHVIPDNIREKYQGREFSQNMSEEDWKMFPFGEINSKPDSAQQIKYYKLLSGVIHSEVCSVIAETMRKSLEKHWEKSKNYMNKVGSELVSLIIFQIFAILVDPNVRQSIQRGKRRCTLRMML